MSRPRITQADTVEAGGGVTLGCMEIVDMIAIISKTREIPELRGIIARGHLPVPSAEASRGQE